MAMRDLLDILAQHAQRPARHSYLFGEWKLGKETVLTQIAFFRAEAYRSLSRLKKAEGNGNRPA